ncbi:MAG: plasmid mobilization protein [Hassallia sp.]
MARKDSHLTVRISPEELEEIKEFAASNGMQQSEFVMTALRAAMGKAGVHEQFLTLSARLAALEARLEKQPA